jgi:outer membrane protein assembly factor BamB
VRRVSLVTLAVATFVAGLGAASVSAAPTGAARTAGTPIGPGDWPTYGHDAQHTFHGQTTITPTTAGGLGRAWLFPTGDAVTATPTVVAGTVYVGSWDTRFYAIDLATGQLRWQFQLDPQPKVEPQPGEVPRPFDSDGGMVTSSARFEPGRGKRPDLVIFGGGYTLYALRAADGSVYWKHGYPGRPDQPPDPAQDGTRIFSSPVVADGKVIIGTSVNGDRGRRGYVVATSLRTGNPAWLRETDVNSQGKVLNDGCGSVWSSGTLLPKAGLVVFDVADCHFANPPPLSETVVALHVRNGRIAWIYRPRRNDTQCDFDFGATVNAGVRKDRTASFLGVGGKEGTYYSLDPANGKERWHTNVVFGGFSGGFIATAAYDGRRVYGSTALGDFGRFSRETGESIHCEPNNPATNRCKSQAPTPSTPTPARSRGKPTARPPSGPPQSPTDSRSTASRSATFSKYAAPTPATSSPSSRSKLRAGQASPPPGTRLFSAPARPNRATLTASSPTRPAPPHPSSRPDPRTARATPVIAGPPLARAVFSLFAKTMRAKRGLLEDGSAELGG